MLKRRPCVCMLAILATALFSVLHHSAASPEDRVGEELKDARLKKTSGKKTKLLKYHKGDVLVIAYTGLGCPISGKYAPRLQKLSKEYRKKGVRFVGINANPQDNLKKIAAEAKELGITFPMLQDYKQTLTKQLAAQTTTEVFVVDKDRVIRYRGMVDDQYAVGENRDRPKNRYLEKAIEAVLDGKEPHVTRTAAPGCLITVASKKKSEKSGKKKKKKITYSSHVAKIIQDNCTQCHRSGQIGPFPLATYEDVFGWSAMIHSVVKGERMPPWNADSAHKGQFLNERRLSKREKSRLLSWIDDGMPRGNPKKDPPPKKWPKRKWRIGKPDKVYTMKKAFVVPKEGVVPYQYFSLPTKFKEDKWIVAMEAVAGAKEVVHHILAFIENPNGNSDRIGLEDGFLCAQVPGDTPSIFPKGCAKKLPAGATLILQVHYTTNGKAARDRSSIGLIFADEPIEREVLTRGIYNEQFSIPPGSANHEVISSHTFREDIELLAFMPHMHTRGKDFRYDIQYPDGKNEEILSVPRYDFNWQESYILKKPLFLPMGTKIECTAHFDNSEDNFDNPDPTATVKWGEQTWEEMMIGYIDYIPARDKAKVASAR